MHRINTPKRKNWEQIIDDQGLLYHAETNYWAEGSAYQFTAQQIDDIEDATQEIWDMCLETVEYVIQKKMYSTFFIPEKYAPLIERSWRENALSLYGRMDLAYNNGNIKLLEFNADTPTGLLESSVIQWQWLEDLFPEKDQFNSIHEHLQERFKYFRPHLLSNRIHFSCVRDFTEDYMTVKYLQDVAAQMGYDTDFLYIDEIGFDEANLRFVNDMHHSLRTVFKLYPYEWMFNEEFGEYLINTFESCQWIEPVWKAILSNKMILKVLYKLFPTSPYILPCEYGKPITANYVRKPVFSREGANVQIVNNGKIIEETSGDYGEEGYIYQQYTPLPNFGGNYPIIGSWIVGNEPCGMGIRESSGLITNNTSRFVPHFFE